MKFIVFLVAAVEFLYILCSSLFLNGGPLFALVNSDPKQLLVTYDFAFSPFPGLTYVRNVGVRVQDANIQLYFQLNSAWLQVDVLGLLRREFGAHWVRGEGLDFRLRFRQNARQSRSTHFALLPPIPGLPTIDKTTEPPQPEFDPWKINLRSVSVESVRQVWLEQYRFTGDSRVQGSFFLFPGGRRLILEPSDLTIRSGLVRWGDVRAAERLEGKLRVRIHELSPRREPGNRFFDFVDAELAMTGKLRDLSFLRYYLHKLSWLLLLEGSGPLTIKATVKKGVFESGSSFALESAHFAADLWRQRVRGRGKIRWWVDKKEAVFRLELGEFELRHHDETIGLLGKEFEARFEMRDLHLANPFSVTRAHVSLPSAKIVDLRYANDFIPAASGIKIIAGTGEVNATLGITPAPLGDKGLITARIVDALVEVEGTLVKADLELHLPINSGSLQHGATDISGTALRLARVAGAGGAKDWWAEISLKPGRLQLGKHPRIAGTLRVAAKDAAPLIDLYLFSRHGSIPPFIHPFLSFEDLNGELDIDASEHELHLRNLSATGKFASLHGWLDKVSGQRSGVFLLQYGPLAAGLQLRGSDGVRLRLQDAIGWFKEKKQVYAE